MKGYSGYNWIKKYKRVLKQKLKIYNQQLIIKYVNKFNYHKEVKCTFVFKYIFSVYFTKNIRLKIINRTKLITIL